MTQNPFGEGGFDLNAMMQQAQQMQEQLLRAQEELAASTVQGTAGGVSVTLTGTGDLTAVTIAPGTFDSADADSLADLGDLVVAAYRDGKGQVDALAARTLGPLAGGLGGDPGALGDLGLGGLSGGSFGGTVGGPGV